MAALCDIYVMDAFGTAHRAEASTHGVGKFAPVACAGPLLVNELVALETAQGNRIHRLHPHDPSWQNWPVLERAVTGNIVPDFPLINKSFNLSYSGHDL